MPRPHPSRLLIETYPFETIVPTRWADLDLLGHINNVSMAGLFEEGRGRFNRALELHRSGKGIRWLIAAVSINYVGEAHYPGDVIVASGIGPIGTRSWTILSGAFQQGRCVATCDTTLVYTDAGGPTAFPPEFREKFLGVSIQS
ncbi:MAG: acyl-CoA thioesterase [Sphingomonadaceae bacterium]